MKREIYRNSVGQLSVRYIKDVGGSEHEWALPLPEPYTEDHLAKCEKAAIAAFDRAEAKR